MTSLVICASGPSLTEVGLERLRSASGIHLLAINSPHPALPLERYNYWAMCDWIVAERHMDQIRQYQGTIISPLRLPDAKYVMDFKILRGMGFSRNIAEGYFIGRSTLYVCLQWALEKCYKRIFVLGLDLDPLDGRRWHAFEEPHNGPGIRAKRFDGEALYLKYAASQMTDEERASIVLGGRAKGWDFVNSFTNLSPETAVSHILSHSLGVV